MLSSNSKKKLTEYSIRPDPSTICSHRSAMNTEFAFMDDNARLHQANIVNEFLQSEFITPIEWPAFSPGLNPAQHV
ncbi:hypothetical protein TNCV_585411 [Trichonephila clavipes]|nr:hypothetical protein TNCV_585411 [Trichonephila clavipes]